jgi:hypothetical protein
MAVACHDVKRGNVTIFGNRRNPSDLCVITRVYGDSPVGFSKAPASIYALQNFISLAAFTLKCGAQSRAGIRLNLRSYQTSEIYHCALLRLRLAFWDSIKNIILSIQGQCEAIFGSNIVFKPM